MFVNIGIILSFAAPPAIHGTPTIALAQVGEQPVSFTAGVRYWAESPDSGPVGWAFVA
jgi:hypothetical protein